MDSLVLSSYSGDNSNYNNRYNKNSNSDSFSNNNNEKYKSKIMILDDDFDIATMIKMTLQRYGFNNLSIFTEPSVALRELRDGNSYSLVISDIRMPGMNGFEFANYINKVDPDIKLILMTAFDINKDLLTMSTEYDTNIVARIIQKPISPKKLATIVSAL